MTERRTVLDTAPKTCVREIPMDDNGYVPVARPALVIPAVQVQEGDILLLDVYVSRVSRVDLVSLGDGRDLRVMFPYDSVEEIARRTSGTVLSPMLWIKGDQNVARFPHELVRVIR